MSDEDEDEGEGEDGDDEGGEEGGGRSFSAKKIGLFVGLPVLLLIGGGIAAYFTGLLDPLFSQAEEEHVEEVIPPEEVVFIDLPEMLINLNSPGNQVSFLKLTVSIEVKDPEVALRLEELMPRVIDNFQVFLRELRVEDLTGARGTYRIKEELLARVNAAVAPARVEDVLFKELLVQ